MYYLSKTIAINSLFNMVGSLYEMKCKVNVEANVSAMELNLTRKHQLL